MRTRAGAFPVPRPSVGRSVKQCESGIHYRPSMTATTRRHGSEGRNHEADPGSIASCSRSLMHHRNKRPACRLKASRTVKASAISVLGSWKKSASTTKQASPSGPFTRPCFTLTLPSASGRWSTSSRAACSTSAATSGEANSAAISGLSKSDHGALSRSNADRRTTSRYRSPTLE